VRGQRLALLVGPEGGFTPAERAAVEQAGGTAFSWGARVLRVETACLALATLVLYEAEQAGWEPARPVGEGEGSGV